MKIGNLEIPHGLFLAPMAGVTDRSFRRLCRRHGAEFTVSEMVSAKALCFEQRGRGSAPCATAPLAAIAADEAPMAIQIFGHEPEYMAEAARRLAEGNYRGCVSERLPAIIDINMGCPVRKVTANGEGSALMKTPRLAGEIVSSVVRSVSVPVTVKIRAGWDASSVNAVEMAKIIEDAGAAAIFVHARTRAQMYSPGIDLGVIEAVKNAVSLPVIGNGDIDSGSAALAMMEKTGCDGVMVGRGATGNPWLFSEILAAMEGREWIPPTVEERMATASEHLAGMIDHKGDRVGLAEAKKHMAWYLFGLRGAASARTEIMNSHSAEEIRAILTRLVSEQDGREDALRDAITLF